MIAAGETVGFGVEPSSDSVCSGTIAVFKKANLFIFYFTQYLVNGTYSDSNGVGFEYSSTSGFSVCGPAGQVGIASCQFGRFLLSNNQAEILYDLILITVRIPSPASNSLKLTLPPPSSSSISQWGLMFVLTHNWTSFLFNNGVRSNGYLNQFLIPPLTFVS